MERLLQHGDESLPQSTAQKKLPRLLELKKKWDPKGLFSFNNALPVNLVEETSLEAESDCWDGWLNIPA